MSVLVNYFQKYFQELPEIYMQHAQSQTSLSSQLLHTVLSLQFLCQYQRYFVFNTETWPLMICGVPFKGCQFGGVDLGKG